MRKIAQILEAFSEKLNFRKNGAEVRKLLILDWSTRVAYVFFKLITIRSKHFLGCEQHQNPAFQAFQSCKCSNTLLVFSHYTHIDFDLEVVQKLVVMQTSSNRVLDALSSNCPQTVLKLSSNCHKSVSLVILSAAKVF